MKAKKHSKLGLTLIFGGLALMLAAALLVCYNVWDERRAEQSVHGAVESLSGGIQAARDETVRLTETARAKENKEFVPDYLLDPTRDMPTEEKDEVVYVGLLEVPVLGLSLPVIDQWSYPGLKLAPCRYQGTAYQPGFVIAAHNYESHFGRIKDLSQGDEIVFTDLNGNAFSYSVVTIEILEPTDIKEMTSDEWDLTLFTCTIGGQARVSVRCERTEELH